MKTAGIIGGSGFIGSYTTKKFLDNNYKVKASVTDLSKRAKYRHLENLENADNLEIHSLDVEDFIALWKFVQDCEILIHCGTPYQLDVKDPNKQLFDPTINGTCNFLKILDELPSVEQVVFVASVATYNPAFPLPAENKGVTHVYTENDNPFVDEDHHPYAQAKYYANQAVQQFIKDNPGIKFEIVSVSPTLVVGEPLSDRRDATSAELQYLLKNNDSTNPFVATLIEQDVEFAMVDVEDVAECVYRAATKKGNHGKNYLISGESWKVSDISLMLNNKEPKGTSRMVYSNHMASKDLGIDFKPVQKSLNKFGKHYKAA